MGLKSAQAWGCPCSIKCLFKDLSSLSYPFSILSLFLLVVLEISWLYQWAQPLNPFPFVVGVDSWLPVRSWLWGKVSIGSHTPCFSPNTTSGFLPSYDSASRPPPPSPFSLSFSVFLWVAGRAYRLEGVGEMGEEPNYSTTRKGWPAINHSILPIWIRSLLTNSVAVSSHIKDFN